MGLSKIYCLIVDDEPLAVQVIATHLEKVSDVEIVATCTSAIKAYELIQSEHIDLVFLDIQMPELTGIDLIKTLEHPPRVIFTTAYRDYAIEGFDLDVVDYLLKPVSLPRLLRALDKYRRLPPSSNPTATDNEDAHLVVRSNRKTVRLALKDILYIESLSDYVNIHMGDEVVTSKERISNLEKKLEEAGFLRIHRSFLVATDKISAFSTDEVQIGQTALPISRSYKQAVKQFLATIG